MRGSAIHQHAINPDQRTDARHSLSTLEGMTTLAPTTQLLFCWIVILRPHLLRSFLEMPVFSSRTKLLFPSSFIRSCHNLLSTSPSPFLSCLFCGSTLQSNFTQDDLLRRSPSDPNVPACTLRRLSSLNIYSLPPFNRAANMSELQSPTPPTPTTASPSQWSPGTPKCELLAFSCEAGAS